MGGLHGTEPYEPVPDRLAAIVRRARGRARRHDAPATAQVSPRGPGAVVLGGDYQGLGIVRSLGALGAPVCVVDDERSIGPFSRHATYAFRVQDLADGDRLLDNLLAIGQGLSLDGWMLFPTRDETVAAISERRDQLSGLFRVPTPDWSTVRWAWDKRNTHHLGAELGVPVPRTCYPGAVDDLDEIDFPFPVAVKPAIKPDFMRATRAKAWKADDRDELSRLFHRAREIVGPGEVMVQELIPGDGRRQFAYCSFFRDGRAVGSMTVRRLRQHPPLFGRASTYVETIDLPLLEDLSKRVLRALAFYGLVELEYKFDARTGEYKLLDINARTWGYHSLGALAGVDFPQLLFLDQIGEDVEPRRARAGVRWMRITTDLPTALGHVLGGELSLRSYARSARRTAGDAVFSWQDPLPGMVELTLIPYLAAKRGF
jgi:D-aspartate ligase